ncbi:uncharacterized protein TRIADDRAFT_22181 [Trichoplax adhaerens]|uniref:Wiskott-Aldrich syndrome protein family member n=1 Tax=Trichoplax adhaerens TaxID=10228 RepID=B3RT38_TRIAD|nr:hypothetical protein TRIADDRAFT_22181 [Trichoplax adhaerens]EDV27161.1 hypothetical protein TRIADDRAFT_22181 [Trichoplax adhaerens]|eukprot:XP_002111157.1 hypothetical protein TRIADDRAFT_22181 [Trichoplax adhaerens]
MPLIVRAVGPSYVSRRKLDRSIRDELEGVSFNSLVGVLQQLSSLAHHTEELFSELSKEAETIFERTSTLKARVDKLTVVVESLDPNEEQVALASANMRKPFKSTYTSEQQVLSRSNLPTALLKIYDDSKRPPNLRLMNAYRDDNKDAMKFYTDPQYFFDLWAKSVVEETQKRQVYKLTIKDSVG